MISVEKREQIRRAYFNENKSIRAIARELKCSRRTVEKAIASAEPSAYSLRVPRSAPVLGPYKERIDAKLAENERLPRKQRYTARRIYEVLVEEGYKGSASGVHVYVWKRRKETKPPKLYLPLEFDAGQDAQVDWGDGEIIMAGEQVTAQLFVMRLCYSRKPFVMAFPAQKQEAFFAGHVAAFHHFEGVPRRIAYDNLRAAVREVLEGHDREEQRAFVVFRSHYLFESQFCTPGQGHEKGSVEHIVGFSRRNYLVPLPEVASYAELNAYLLDKCQQGDRRQVEGQPRTIGEMWAEEKGALLPLPERDFACCVSVPVTLNPYSQVVFQTNKYSVPVDLARRNLVLRAYPFEVEILHQDQVIARHPRCYERKQEIYDPLHYLPLLAERPRAFEHAKPLRQWRASWPPVYEQLLARLRAQDTENQSVRTFVQILSLHRRYPPDLIEQAITQALDYGCLHADGVALCLRQLMQPETPAPIFDLSTHPQLMGVGTQTLDLSRYDQLLGGPHGS
jgi:transposase